MKFFNSDTYDDFDHNSNEEAHLLEKFNDYIDLEKKIAKKQFLEMSDTSETGRFGKRFIISAMVQGAIVTGLTIALLLNQILVFNGDIENMFEFSFTDKSGIFFFGYILQIVLTAGLATIGIFYNHFETNAKKTFSESSNIFSWINLIGTNLFGSMITTSLIFAGIATSSLYQTEFFYVLSSIPDLVYTSAILFVISLGVGIIGTSMSLLKKKYLD